MRRPPPRPSRRTSLQATLTNGLRVILVPNRLAPVATVVMEYGVGANDDTLPGIAHATEHMLFRGTNDVSAAQFSEIATRMGADYNAETANEYTIYYFKLPASYVDVAIHLESDRMNGASIRPDAWKTERKAIEQEISAQESVPGYKVALKLRQLMFGDSIFARASGGTIPSFEKMTAGDIATFYRTWYRPNNATLIVAGDIDTAKTLDRIRAAFDPLPSAALPVRAPLTVPAMAATTLQDKVDLPVSFSALLYRSPGTRDPDYNESQILSRVFNNDRGPIAELTTTGKILGGFDLSSAFPEVGVSAFLAIPTAAGTPAQTVTLLDGIVSNYATNGVPHDLIVSAQTRLLSEQAYSSASISGVAFDWAQAIANGQRSPSEGYESLAKVTDVDVNRLMRAYFGPQHQITAILTANPSVTASHVDKGSGVENVGYTPEREEPLPAWAVAALDAPLVAPHGDADDLRFELPNGLTVAVRRETTSPTVILSGEIETSPALYEPKGREGVAQLTESLLPWGTTTYDRKQYSAQIDDIAANVSLGTSFALTVRSKDLDRGVQLLSEAMLRPSFPDSGFGVDKNELMQAIAINSKLPSQQASRAEAQALYAPGDPRRREASVASVARIAPGDVRKWYAFAYRPDLTTIAVVGDVTPADAKAIVTKYFGGWKATGKTPNFRFPPLAAHPSGETITVKSPTNTQSQVTLKQIIPLRHWDGDYVPLLLANTILSGEGTGSLLFRELRTRDGYVYDVDSDLSVERSGATFSISFASKPRDVDRAQAAAVAVLEHMQKVPFPDVELQRAKALLLALRILPLDSYAGVADHVLANAQDDTPAAVTDAFWKAIVNTTPEQVRAAVQRKLRPTHFIRVIVAPDN